MTTSTEGSWPGAGEPEAAHDSDAALQEELRREAGERDAIGGDTATDRNLTGSSTWVTLGSASDDSVGDQPDAPDGRGRPGAP
jgi:hypothetical protein